MQVVFIEGERLDEGVEDLAGDHVRVRLRRQVDQHHDELVAAESRDRVAVAHGALQPRGDDAQQPVADRVAEAVVDVLEAVQVEHHHRDQLPGAARLRHRLLHPVAQQVAIGQAGERIVVGKIFDAALLHLALGDVLHDAAQDDRVVRIAPRLRLMQHAALGAVRVNEPMLERERHAFGAQARERLHEQRLFVGRHGLQQPLERRRRVRRVESEDPVQLRRPVAVRPARLEFPVADMRERLRVREADLGGRQLFDRRGGAQ